jgi:hypothetical protein
MPTIKEKKYLITINQGATFRRTFTWKTATGNPMNLTGSSIIFQLKSMSGNSKVTTFGEDYVSIDDGAKGIFTITIPAEQTELLLFDRARYLITITLSNGDVVNLLQGDVKIIKKFS